MSASLPLVTTLATALGLALVMGFVAIKLKLPTLVGYLLAGILIGPFTPGFVADTQIASELAELGVMLLMFGVGLHFSVDNLLEMRKIALPGALIQITVATILGATLATIWGWDFGGALVFGLALSVASTVVLIRALESQGIIKTIDGQIAIGWLIVEDLAMIVVLVVLPLIAEWIGGNTPGNDNQNIWSLIGITIFKVSAFICIMLFVGRWIFPKLLWHIARTGSRELFTLCIIAAAVSIAYLAFQLFGTSLALGAFFAGMVISESRFSHRAAEESLPFQDAFAVLFFVSIGMLFDPNIFIEHPLHVLVVVGIIVIGKSIAALILVLAFKYPLSSALIISASLAQIGEFSFILATLGVQLELLPLEGQGLIVAGALISISLNSLLFRGIHPILAWVESKPKLANALKRTDDLIELPGGTEEKYLSKQVVLIGYGEMGAYIEKILTQNEIPFVIVEENRDVVSQLRKRGIAAVCGDAVDPNTLIQAHIARAGMIVITISDTFNTRQMIDIAVKLNPIIEAAVHVFDEEEAELMSEEINGKFFISELELVKNMSRYILTRFGID